MNTTARSWTTTCFQAYRLALALLLLLLVAAPAQAQWPKSFGGDNYDGSTDIAIDGNGNVYVTGSFRGENVDFGGTLVSSTPNDSYSPSDIFIAKYTSAGTLVWVHAIGGTNNDEGHSIAVDSGGNVYVTGSFSGEDVDFRRHAVSADGISAFIAKYTSAGTVAWVHTISNSYYLGSGGGIAVDSGGNVYVTGSFRGENVDFGGTLVSSTLHGNGVQFTPDIFVAKYEATGALVWVQAFGGTQFGDVGYDIAVDASSNVYVTGSFEDDVDFGGMTVSSNFTEDIFILKCDAIGTPVWVRAFGGTDTFEYEAGRGIAVDVSGNVYVTGTVNTNGEDIDFGGIAMSADRSFIAKYDATGALAWVLGDAGGGFDIALDENGDAYLGGSIYGGGSTIASYDPAGMLLWASDIDAISSGIALDERPGSNALVYTTGVFEGTVDFHPDISGGTRSASGPSDAFIARYHASDGSALFALTDPPLLYYPKWRPFFPQLRFEIDILIGADTNPVEDLFGAGFRFEFDPEVMSFQGATAGDFLTADGIAARELLIFINTDELEQGNLAMSLSRKRSAEGLPVTGISGHGVLATLTFEVNRNVKDGETQPQLFDVLAVNAVGHELVVNAYPPDPIRVRPLAVWPGDTDNNGRAELRDLFPIGNCYGVRGPVRGFDLSWLPQAMGVWEFGGGVADPCTPEVVLNPAYADATGDGLVSQNDILPLGLNFSLTHEAGYDATGGSAAATKTASKTMEEVARLSLGAKAVGERHRVAITVGTESDPMASLFGIAARLRVPPGALRVVSVEAGPLLDNGDLLSIDQHNAETGVVEAAYTRKRGAESVTGHGEVIVVELEVVQAMAAPVEVVLELAEANVFGSGVVPLTAADVQLGESATATSAEDEASVPGSYVLEAAYPNPFHGATTINYVLPEAGEIRLAVYDVLGREVALLAEGMQSAGTHEARFESSSLMPGVYFYRMQAGSYSETRRLLLLK